MVQILSVACVLLCLVGASGHTLVVCTDLSADRQTCNGYSRSVDIYMTRNDAHLIDADKSGPPCGDFNTLTDASYSATYPMAKADAGQKITIGWPSNNHQKANPSEGVPDSRNSGDDNVKIYQTQLKQPDRTILDKTAAPDLIATASYSNCFSSYNKDFTARSAGNEKYFCTAELTMPTTPGTYTYVWAWKLAEFYYSCFDVEVGGSIARPPTPPTPAVEAPTPAPTPVPGSAGACSSWAMDYCRAAGFSSCYKSADDVNTCGTAPKDTTGEGTSSSDCPQIIKDFCSANYPGSITCAPKPGGSYSCLQGAASDTDANDQVKEPVDTINSNSDIAKEAAAAAGASTGDTGTGGDMGSGASYSVVFSPLVLLLLGCTFFAHKQ